ncbi:hypothetical protein Bca4012_013382 [Brassica carinata]
MATKNGGGGPPVSASDTSFIYGLLSPVIYMSLFGYSIENLKALQKLVLSGCKSFATFPKIEKNMKHLKRFDVNQGESSSCSHCDLREWPHGIYTLSSVQRLCLSRNNFRSLLDNIRYLYSLKWLDLKYCEQLISLPVIPPNLHWLDAHGCISLENIGSQLALILAETEHPHSTFTFTNCTKLDQAAKNGIVSYVRRKIQSMSDALAHQEKGSKLDVLIGVCYPSWQLPVWFNYRTVGSELKQNLPRHWNEDGLTGIALCAVVSFKDYQAKNNRLLVRCTAEFKEKDEPFIQFSRILGGWTEHGSDRPRDIITSSGHVFIGYTSLLHIKKWGIEALFAATEASFEFEVTDGTNQITNCEVVKCGFTLIYAPNKHVHPFCSDSEKRSDHGGTICGPTTGSGGNINDEESHFQILSGETSSSSVALKIGREITEKVHIKSRDKTVAASSKGDSGIPLEVSFDATTKNNNGGSMSSRSSEGGEVIDEESPKTGETNPGVETSATHALFTSPGSSGGGEVIDEESSYIDEINIGVETRSFESLKDTEKTGDEKSARNGANNLCERMEKPIRLICLVIPIFFKVKPITVKRLRGAFGDQFRDREWEYRCDKPRTDRWKEALASVSCKIGLTFDKKSNESKFVRKIVKEVKKMLQGNLGDCPLSGGIRDTASLRRQRSSQLVSTQESVDPYRESISLVQENSNIANQVAVVSKCYTDTESENHILTAQFLELTERLRSLNSVIEMVEGVVEIPDFLMNPWQMSYPSQPAVRQLKVLIHFRHFRVQPNHDTERSVIPIFFNVEPVTVKQLRGAFGDKFRDREWEYCDESKFVRIIVEEVKKELQLQVNVVVIPFPGTRRDISSLGCQCMHILGSTQEPVELSRENVLVHEKSIISNQIVAFSKAYMDIEYQNNVLRAQLLELSERLQALNFIIEMSLISDESFTNVLLFTANHGLLARGGWT